MISTAITGGMGDVLIRQMKVHDLEAVTGLIAKSPEELFRHHDYCYLMMLRLYPDVCLAAELDGTVVGFCIGCTGGTELDTFFFWQFAVDASVRGKGLGSRLIRTSIEKARRLGCVQLECTITSDESKRAFRKIAAELGSELERAGEMRFREPSSQDWTAEELYQISFRSSW